MDADVKVKEGAPEGAAEGAGNGSAPAGPNGTGAGVSLPSNDVRRKRPPAFSFLLRMETLRTVGRIGSLLALDFAGVFLAMKTAHWAAS